MRLGERVFTGQPVCERMSVMFERSTGCQLEAATIIGEPNPPRSLRDSNEGGGEGRCEKSPQASVRLLGDWLELCIVNTHLKLTNLTKRSGFSGFAF